MARDRRPITKQSRREGYALHPKSHKIMMKKSSPPGQSNTRGRRGPARLSQYGTQLREKQKVKRLYGLLERQFAKLMKEASGATGKSGEVLIILLERRLDNVVYRAGFAASRQAARQLVTHGHFEVNGRRVNVPSIRVSKGDKIAVRARSKNTDYFKNMEEYTSHIEQPKVGWIKSNPKKYEIEITGDPKREEAEPDINEQLIVEFNSR